jgi:hypothetical protein
LAVVGIGDQGIAGSIEFVVKLIAREYHVDIIGSAGAVNEKNSISSTACRRVAQGRLQIV